MMRASNIVLDVFACIRLLRRLLNNDVMHSTASKETRGEGGMAALDIPGSI